MPESPPPIKGDAPRGGIWAFGRLKSAGRALAPLLALLLVIGCFSAADHWKNGKRSEFFTPRNARTIAAPMATVLVPALGMTFIIIAGGIDLSAGTAASLCATVLACALQAKMMRPYDPWAAVVLALAVGSLCGLLNGVLVSWLRIVPFIVTLGTMRLYLGLGNMLAKETTVRPDRATQVPPWLKDLLSLREEALWLGFPVGVWLALLLAVLAAAALHYTVFSRHVFAVGSNEMSARLCGINVRAMKIAVYTLAGFFFGIGGIYQFAEISVGSPTSGLTRELKMIAAVVIGGASLNGGRGTILGTVVGAGVMAVIENGGTLLALTNPMQDVILAVIIVSAVAIDQLRQRRLAT